MKINDNDLIYLVRGKCIDIHKELGPGLLEKAYQLVLTYELENAGFQVDTEVPIPLKYKNVRLEGGFRADMIVNNRLIIELKSVLAIAPVHHLQLKTYLKLSGIPKAFLSTSTVPTSTKKDCSSGRPTDKTNPIPST